MPFPVITGSLIAHGVGVGDVTQQLPVLVKELAIGGLR